MSAGKVALTSIWEIRMTDLCNTAKFSDIFFLTSCSESNSSDTAAALPDALKMCECNTRTPQSNLYYRGRVSEELEVSLKFKFS